MLPILLGLASGLCWGAADFYGGLQSRRLPFLSVALWSQLGGALGLAVALLAIGGAPPLDGLAWGALAGVFGGAGLAFFYRGLAVGMMSIVAPVAACGAFVPVVVAFVLGQPPAAVALAGMLTAMTGVVLVSLPSETSRHPAGSARLALALALGAAISFGLFFVFLDRGSGADTSPLWVVGGARLGSLTLLTLVALVGRVAAPWPGRRIGVVALIGLVDTLANVLFAFATVAGNLAIVSVLGSMYPITTVVLARVVLSERLAPGQALGVALALVGIGLIALG